jgi:uncharacterized protein HemX
MKKTIALFVSAAFLLGTTGFAVAQTPPPAQEKKADEKTMDKTMEKKPAKKRMTLEERKAACLDKAGTDEAKKAACEKRFAAKAHKMGKKMMEKKDTMSGQPSGQEKK